MGILNACIWLAMIKIFRKWHVLIIDINPLGGYAPRVFMSITRKRYFLNINYSIVAPLYVENCSGNSKYAYNKDETCVSIQKYCYTICI